jgi:hypothetical protein
MTGPLETKMAAAAAKWWPFRIISRGRFDFWNEMLASSEREKASFKEQIRDLKAENAALQSALTIARDQHEQTKQALQTLSDKHQTEVRFVQDVEVRRGLVTDNEWAAFCPKCHLPLSIPTPSLSSILQLGSANAADHLCCSGCEWVSLTSASAIRAALHALNL